MFKLSHLFSILFLSLSIFEVSANTKTTSNILEHGGQKYTDSAKTKLTDNAWEGPISLKLQNLNVFEFQGSRGHFIKTIPGMDNMVNNPYYDFAIRLAYQPHGEKLWEREMGNPIYGLAFYKARFHENTAEVPHPLGSPNAMYVFINAPIIQIDKFSLRYELAAGLSFGFNVYDPVNNPENMFISVPVDCYFHMKTFMEYEISPRFDLALGLGMNHFSNGCVQLPNKGANLLNSSLNIRYHFNPEKISLNGIANHDIFERKTPLIISPPPTQNSYEIDVNYAAGVKAATAGSPYIGQEASYFASSLSFDFLYKYYHLCKLGFGVDAFYESALRLNYSDPNFDDLSYMGYHISHLVNYGRLGLLTEVGAYFNENLPHKGKFYLRVGGRFNFTDNFYGQITLKTRNGAIADFVEWGFGYKLFTRDIN